MPRHERTIRSDGVHLGNEVYDSPDLNDMRTRNGKFEVRQDPYDTDRVWVRHPDTHEWITCFARSIRMAALPFGTTTSANLATTEQVDDPHFEWSQDFLDAESGRVKNAASTNGTPANSRCSDKASQKKATKSAAEHANRKRDSLPRPAISKPTPLPAAVPIRQHPDDYTIA
jgi:hypothetical protein